MNNEKKGNGKTKKIVVGVATVVAVAAIAVPTALTLAGGKDDAGASNQNNRYNIIVSSGIENVPDYSISIEKGTSVSTLKTMLKAIDGYTIKGIFKDENFKHEYADDEAISEDSKIFIMFEAQKFELVILDENKNVVGESQTIDFGSEVALEKLEDKTSELGTYKFLGWADVSTGEIIAPAESLTITISEDMKLYPVYSEIEYNEYQFGYHFGNGNDYSTSITVSVGGEEVSKNDTYHYGSKVKIRVRAKEGFEPSMFQVQVGGGERVDYLTYANMVVVDGNPYYEIELEGNGNIDIYYSEVEARAYSLGTIPDGVVVKRNGNTLTSADTVYFGDELEISYVEFEDCYDIEFGVSGAKHALGDTYFVTGDMSISYDYKYEYSYLNFNKLASGTYEVTSLNDKTKTSITIPETYKGVKVTSIRGSVFKGCSSLTSVTIPTSVTNIGNSTFYGCSSLTSIEIPTSVTNIGNSAFYGCSSLTEIIIPSSVTSIGSQAFCNCSSLTEIIIPSSVTSIGISAFMFCSSLKSVTLPETITSIGEQTFTSCSALTEINIPASVETIGRAAFMYCSNLTSITIPSSVTSIEESAFYDCINLTSVTIESASVYAAAGTSLDLAGGLLANAKEVKVLKSIDNNSNQYMSEAFEKTSEDDKYNIYRIYQDHEYLSFELLSDGTYEVVGFGNASVNNVVIPATYKGKKVTSIGYNAFSTYGMSITSVVIPEGIITISDFAFSQCVNLTSVTIPSSVTSIGSSAFNYNYSLTSVTVESPMIYDVISANLNIGAGELFYYPTEIKILKSIDDGSNSYISDEFEKTSEDEKYNVYTKYQSHAYLSFNKLEDGTYEAAGILDGLVVVDGRIVIPETYKGKKVTSIADNAFQGKSFSSISLPSTITRIGDNAFRDCSSLTSIEIPSSVTSIGYAAFYNCSSLTEIIIPSSVTSIGDWAFTNCSSLTSVTFENTTGWMAGSEAVDVTDPSQNATYLKDTYYSSIWTRS